MAVQTLTLGLATNFALVAGQGFFSMQEFNALPRTTRLLVKFCYYELNDFPTATNIWFWAIKPGGTATERCLIGRGQYEHGLLDPVTNQALLKLCPDCVPRNQGNKGAFWDVGVFSTGKVNVGTVTMDTIVCPNPDTTREDSPQ